MNENYYLLSRASINSSVFLTFPQTMACMFDGKRVQCPRLVRARGLVVYTRCLIYVRHCGPCHGQAAVGRAQQRPERMIFWDTLNKHPYNECHETSGRREEKPRKSHRFRTGHSQFFCEIQLKSIKNWPFSLHLFVYLA